MTDVAPPATAVWYDLDATLAAVLDMLRLREGDVDENRIRALVPTAASAIDNYVDGVVAVVGPPPPAPIQTALELATCELYRRQSHGDDVVGQLDNGVLHLDALSGLVDVYGLVGPSKQRWGVA